ncbi:MAG: U32 family peptidase [Burkholderiales bacterium]|nr:MAG: U32 family peptidase [Burkholderiales bacterium]
MKLALGPVLYYWSAERLLAFYEEAAAAPVDIVYLGETVCSRRHSLRPPDWLALGERLAAAGKEVVLSTQALVESESDLKALRRLVSNGRFLVEANDMAAVKCLAGRGPFVAGTHLNVYNPATLAVLAELGAVRFVAPVEMSQAALAALQAERPAGVATEAWLYGRLPLAFSARCFTARHYNLQKDDCRFRCLDHPEGLSLFTLEGEPFLTLNGVQTLSAQVLNLLPVLDELRALRVDVVRVSPQARHTGRVLEVFRSVLDGTMDLRAALAVLEPLMPGAPCDGYWRGGAGMGWRGQARP